MGSGSVCISGWKLIVKVSVKVKKREAAAGTMFPMQLLFCTVFFANRVLHFQLHISIFNPALFPHEPGDDPGEYTRQDKVEQDDL